MEHIIERFRVKMAPEPNSGCFLWTGAITSAGYGAFKIAGKVYLAHRLAWEFSRGAIPAGLQVNHHCDVRSCCNPSHLFLGTQVDNMADMIRKGRSGSFKITEADVRDIRSKRLKQREYALLYGICKVHVSHIQRRLTWKHIGG